MMALRRVARIACQVAVRERDGPGGARAAPPGVPPTRLREARGHEKGGCGGKQEECAGATAIRATAATVVVGRMPSWPAQRRLWVKNDADDESAARPGPSGKTSWWTASLGTTASGSGRQDAPRGPRGGAEAAHGWRGRGRTPQVWWRYVERGARRHQRRQTTSRTRSSSLVFTCFEMFCAECVKNANTQGIVGLAAHKRCSHHGELTGGARGLPRTGNTPVGPDACRRPGPGGGETAPRRSLRGVLEAVVGERRVADGPRGAEQPCLWQGSRQYPSGGCRPNHVCWF